MVKRYTGRTSRLGNFASIESLACGYCGRPLLNHRGQVPISALVHPGGVRRRLKELAAKRMRFGYRRLTALLVREGLAVNHKRVYRLYREEGLAMRIRQRRRTPLERRGDQPGSDQAESPLVDGFR